ncbi:hypothetical protein F0P96_12230 [Hymenobacter busanensis]|uniref:Uncharacterized protein n=1 Tax=Hymenobacter busanensis TaxID=2607656 RepID=A0AA88JZ64_9BACT|nr:hypothetical protein [Hymenobacter busanensis]KAA9332243.1 hypothetical protein F0P96_12230 [Hymenobacter busanensis]
MLPAQELLRPARGLPRPHFSSRSKGYAKEQLTLGEAQFKADWRGSPYHIVHSVEQALAIVTASGS